MTFSCDITGQDRHTHGHSLEWLVIDFFVFSEKFIHFIKVKDDLLQVFADLRLMACARLTCVFEDKILKF